MRRHVSLGEGSHPCPRIATKEIAMLFVDSTFSPNQRATAAAVLSTATFVAGIVALIACTVVKLLRPARR